MAPAGAGRCQGPPLRDAPQHRPHLEMPVSQGRPALLPQTARTAVPSPSTLFRTLDLYPVIFNVLQALPELCAGVGWEGVPLSPPGPLPVSSDPRPQRARPDLWLTHVPPQGLG